MEYGWDMDERRASIFSALDEWTRFEALSTEKFGAESLKDRDFRKLKLQEYDRLYNIYNSRTDLTRDERGMLLMLRFQRKKLAKALYPRLIRRLYNRATSFIRLRILGSRAKDPFQSDADRYVSPSLYVSDSIEKSVKNENGQRQEQRQGNRIQLGVRGNNNHKSRGQSM
jgi:hypothetical protein